MGGQVAGLNKAGLNELARRGPAKVLADPVQGSLGGATQLLCMTVQGTRSAVLTRPPCAVMMINSAHQRFLVS